jgi:hypothetical protein
MRTRVRTAARLVTTGGGVFSLSHSALNRSSLRADVLALVYAGKVTGPTSNSLPS